MDVKFPYDVRILLNTCLMQQKETMGWNSVVSFLSDENDMKVIRLLKQCRVRSVEKGEKNTARLHLPPVSSEEF